MRVLPRFRRRTVATATQLKNALIPKIRERVEELSHESADVLREIADELRGTYPSDGSRPDDDFLTLAFALVVDATHRVFGITLYDVQLLAGFTLTQGHVAQMQTGEGKTFTAMLPAFVWSRAGRGVHVATSNAWLAERDCQELTPVFELLGTSVGLIQSDHPPESKRAAYNCDVTYAPGYDLGFDYLRDRVALRQDPDAPLGSDFLRLLRSDSSDSALKLQRTLASAVVDEVDNVLIDEAGSPLMLSMDSDRSAEDAAAHMAARALVDDLVDDEHCRIDAAAGSIQLTASGRERIWQDSESLPLKCLLRPWESYVLCALRAKHLIHRDVHYVVKDDKVVIVDESTGRLFEERSWRDGLHQAVEARADVKVTSEKRPLARIARQSFFRLYGQLCGMTGTATGSEREFHEFYALGVTPIPTHRPCQRKMMPTRYFQSADAKWDAIALEVSRIHTTGQPLLIGTRSIATSEVMAARLTARNIDFQLLNGRQDKEEADIVADAGKAGVVTIATNMAGRGTDIKLDDRALQCGGLYVISTEPHESRRVDRQLVGRAARQGQPGSAAFFVSADDALITQFGDWFAKSMHQMNADESGEITSDLSQQIRRIQSQAERSRFVQRRQLFLQENQRDSTLNRITGDAS